MSDKNIPKEDPKKEYELSEREENKYNISSKAHLNDRKNIGKPTKGKGNH